MKADLQVCTVMLLLCTTTSGCSFFSPTKAAVKLDTAIEEAAKQIRDGHCNIIKSYGGGGLQEKVEVEYYTENAQSLTTERGEKIVTITAGYMPKESVKVTMKLDPSKMTCSSPPAK